MEQESKIHKVKLTDRQKTKKWYRDKIDDLATRHTSINYTTFSKGEFDRYSQIRINQDLYNNKIHIEDLKKVLNPFGKKISKINANIKHRDILSPKIKSIIGSYFSRDNKYRLYATNPEATTMAEEEETKRLREYVNSTILAGIKEEVYGSSAQGEITPEIQEQLDAQVKELTPQRVEKFMKRKYQSPYEVLGNQILNYFRNKEKVKWELMKGLEQLINTNSTIFYVGLVGGNPVFRSIDPAMAVFDSSDNEFIQDGDWGVVEYRMTFSEIARFFKDSLSDSELQSIYSDNINYGYASDFFSPFDNNLNSNKIKVLHIVWKDLREIQILTYLDDDGIERKRLVSDEYILNKEAGDISLTIEWIPEVYEGWLIGEDIYTNYGPVEGQIKNLDDLYRCELPYYGIINPVEGSLLSRAKAYSYLFDAALFHIERLMASDKGKKFIQSIKSVPKKFKLNEYLDFFESSPITFFDPTAEGSGYSDVNTMFKVVDLSLASDISKYSEIAKFSREQIGIVMGVPEAMEGHISPYMTKSNADKTLALTSNILEITFKVFNEVRRAALNALIESGKIAFKDKDGLTLSYILDDMSKEYFTINSEILANATYGLFIEDSNSTKELRDILGQLTQAAMQNQAIEMSEAIKILREDGISESIESLEAAEEQRRKREEKMEEMKAQQQQQLLDKQAQLEQQKQDNILEQIKVKEEERRKTELMKAELLGASFNPDMDKDNDGVNDFLEMYYKEKELALKDKELNLKEKEIDAKTKIEKQKLNNPKNK